MVLSLLASTLALPYFSNMRQTIHPACPSTHLQKKGTITAAGLVFIPVACLCALPHSTSTTLQITAFVVGALMVGLLDDVRTVTSTTSKKRGLTAGTHLKIQLACAACLAAAVLASFPQPEFLVALTPAVLIPLPRTIYLALCSFTYVSHVNGVNITDGLDGLAATCTSLILSTVGLLISAAHPDVAHLCGSFSGAVCGFSWLNRYPARMFMGNCGSHALGAAYTCSHGVVAPLSAILAAEAASCLLQLGWYRWTALVSADRTGRRLFLRAPFHHHLELCSWHETEITNAAAALQMTLCVLVLVAWSM
jgi:phospho-N-acetylmuramoyl-pentapeptide-transferase